eukprot:2430270-Rhodomonas_salina.3
MRSGCVRFTAIDSLSREEFRAAEQQDRAGEAPNAPPSSPSRLHAYRVCACACTGRVFST